MSTIKRNQKDSIASTWRTSKRSEWTPFHWFYELLVIHPTDLDKPIPVHKKTDKLAYIPEWEMHLWILIHAFLPIGLQYAYQLYTGQHLHPILTFLLYSAAFKLHGIRQFRSLRVMGHQIGFLDGDEHTRDGVPDVGVAKVVCSLILTSTVRPFLAVLMSYQTEVGPDQMNWLWLPIEIGFYGIILDFWFYWYHRLMHEVEGLWKFHRTHHLTKHPNPLLTLYADEEQELFDIAGIPVMTFLTMRAMGFPIDFYSWTICQQYVMFAEVSGHSGLRLYTSPPSTLTWLLRYFDAELVIEDHDLHHRKGWKSSGNYGKQTRLWDRIFGTCKDRIETSPGHVDYENPVHISYF